MLQGEITYPKSGKAVVMFSVVIRGLNNYVSRHCEARSNPLKISAYIWIASFLPMTSRVLVIAGLTRNPLKVRSLHYGRLRVKPAMTLLFKIVIFTCLKIHFHYATRNDGGEGVNCFVRFDLVVDTKPLT
jgi:hypothetical protein